MKKSFLVSALFFLLCASGCMFHEGVNPYFHATVLEVYDSSILVEPYEDEEETKSSDLFIVSTDVVSTHEVPALEKGSRIRILYNGDIAESSPAQIDTVFAIYLIDDNGELIE